jgi:succinate dehydrogenase / fumarate reductase, flavoprotein subunit
VMLQTLYENAVKNQVKFFSEYFLTELIIEDGICKGVAAIDMATSEIHVFHAKSVMFATGGYGRAFRITSNAHVGTGDGCALTYKAGLPLEDMEFYQFHPTGLWRLGILVSEAARGEGGILRNNKNEPFMEVYAPTVKDLAPRDMVSRAIISEIRAGRGILGSDGTNYINLDLTHLGKKVIDEKIPEITGFARTYLGVEPTKESVPIQPTAHYAMGGIPTNSDTEVYSDNKGSIITGFYAAGECACVSVHGANRLGTNSLLDIVVFGRRGGKKISEFLEKAEYSDFKGDPTEKTREEMNRLLDQTGGEKVAVIRRELQENMMDKCGIFRNEGDLKQMKELIKQYKERYAKLTVQDKSKVFNTDLIETIELGNLLDIAETINDSALNRPESRGAHTREDFPNRNDAEWMKHTFIYKDSAGGDPKIDYKAVTKTRFEPMERKY